ncbi:PQQ-dependent sugar dehydrogenase [Geitlerinema splendidum]|jgi:glucose/arabinose dehydrogenase|nr:PQQ-dependent sugar dehydrogenase [Geitlerinema splendidum]
MQDRSLLNERRFGKVSGALLYGIIMIAAGWLLGRGMLAHEIADELSDKLPYPVLSLTAPEDGVVFDDVSTVVLEWISLFLPDDAIYDVRVWRDGDPAYGITWTREHTLDLRKWLLDQPEGDFNWSVAALKPPTDDDEATEIVVTPARRFTVRQSTLNILDVPEGFSARMVARLPVEYPTVITFDENGSLYVLSLEGNIVRLRDEDGDGEYETSQFLYLDEQDALNHAVGMAIHAGSFYVSSGGQISILNDTDGDGVLDEVNVILDGLPSMVHPYHSNNGIAFGPDGKLYISVGSTTDHGPVIDPLEASILRVNPDGTELEVYATGIRNAYDIVFSPEGDLYTADNSPDHLDPSFNTLFAEELNVIVRGGHYGFPEVFGQTERADIISPIAELPTSSASSGITYYAADQFPQTYQGIYVALFGTGAASIERLGRNTGKMVVFIPIEKDAGEIRAGTWQPFARFQTGYFDYSPIDVAVGPDGSLYIAEWTTATLHRVRYEGAAEGADTGALAEMSAGEALYLYGKDGVPACVTCHVLQEDTASLGPSLLGLSEVAASRVPGLNAEAYIRQSILDPNAYIVPGYQAGLMFTGYDSYLTADEVEALVTYIMNLASGESPQQSIFSGSQ